MIYVCIPSHNEAPTIGLLLWKIRQVFAAFEREYQLLVGDDGSDDATREVLQPYTRVLPLTVTRNDDRQGYARTAEQLLRLAVDRTDRPKRDCAILMHADFTHDPACIPDLVRRLCWEPPETPDADEVRARLEAGRARQWQIGLTLPLLVEALRTEPGPAPPTQ